MKSPIGAWLGFSAREMKGLTAVLLLLTLILSLPYVIDSLTEPLAYDKTQDQAALDSLAEWMSAQLAARTEEPAAEAALQSPVIKPFDPNALDAQGWAALGLKPYLAERAVKYRTKVAPFRIKRDLLKVYGFPERLYERLAPFILLPDTLATSPQVAANENKITDKQERGYAFKQPQKFDLNTADTAQLIALKGIGAVTAARIIKYREALGGFHSLEQLNEVYAITPEALASLAAYATLVPDSHRKIPVNTADAETLKKHPYIGYKLAEVIVNYRNRHGAYKSSEDLKKIRILTPETLEKLLPYLEF